MSGNWEDLHMNNSRQFVSIAVATVLGTLAIAGLSKAQELRLAQDKTLELPDLIREAIAKNPEIAATRKQREAATSRIAQVQTLDDPTVSVQLWNIPQSFNVTQTQNTIIGLSQSFPFPGKLSLKGE